MVGPDVVGDDSGAGAVGFSTGTYSLGPFCSAMTYQCMPSEKSFE